METLLILIVVCTTLIVIAYMSTRVVAQYYRAKAELSRKMANVRRQSVSKPVQTAPNASPELGAWVKDLVQQLGHAEDELYEDEMPDELQDLLNSPLAKSFLSTVSQGAGKTEQQNTPTDSWF